MSWVKVKLLVPPTVRRVPVGPPLITSLKTTGAARAGDAAPASAQTASTAQAADKDLMIRSPDMEFKKPRTLPRICAENVPARSGEQVACRDEYIVYSNRLTEFTAFRPPGL